MGGLLGAQAAVKYYDSSWKLYLAPCTSLILLFNYRAPTTYDLGEDGARGG